jgi:hypothetical protein
MRRTVAGLLAALMIAPATQAADGPNLLVEISRAVISAAAGDSRDRPEVVNDDINGTRVTGTGQSHADITVDLVPSPHRIAFDLVLSGTARTKTIGHAGVVDVLTNGFTQFVGRKRINMDLERFDCQPASVRVRMDTQLAGVGTGFAGPLDRVVTGIAARVYYQEQDENNREAARMTERSIATEFDRDAGRQVADAFGTYLRQRADLRRRGLWPQSLRMYTTSDELCIRGRLSDDNFRLVSAGDAVPPPTILGRPDVALRIHQSLFNNAAARQFGGRTVTGDELDRTFTTVLGPQNPGGGRLETEEKEQFTVTFAAEPVTVEFAGGYVRATIHTCGFTTEDRQITDPFDIRIGYELVKTPATLSCTRRELEVLPAAVASGKRRMSLRENSIAKLLSKRFAKLLPDRQDVMLADLPGGLKKLGRLLPTQAESEGGWIVLAWRQPR